jgi:hypothetical protein
MEHKRLNINTLTACSRGLIVVITGLLVTTGCDAAQPETGDPVGGIEAAESDRDAVTSQEMPDWLDDLSISERLELQGVISREAGTNDDSKALSDTVIIAAQNYSRTEGIAILVNPGRDLEAEGITGDQVGSFLVQKLQNEDMRSNPKAFVFPEVRIGATWIIFLVHSHHPASYDGERFPQLYDPMSALEAVPEIIGLYGRHLDLQEEYREQFPRPSEKEGRPSTN